MESYEDMDPIGVLRLLAKGIGRDLGLASVDGLQSITTDPGDSRMRDSDFQRALANIGNPALGDVFLWQVVPQLPYWLMKLWRSVSGIVSSYPLLLEPGCEQ
jgi:hypothetical protein